MTIDVGVEDADLEAALGHPEREVDGDGRLADAALARRHGDDVLDARYQLLGLARLRAADHRSPGQIDCLDAKRRQHPIDVCLDLVLQRAGGRGQLDHERNARAVDAQVADHVTADDVTGQLGFAHRAKRVKDGCFGDRHDRWGPFAWGHALHVF